MTFCNQNRVNCDKVKGELEGLRQESDNLTQNILLWIKTNVCTDLVSGQPDPLSSQLQNRSKRESGKPGETPSYVESEYTFVSEYMSLQETTRRSIGHDFYSLIKSCTFRGKDCLHIRFRAKQ